MLHDDQVGQHHSGTAPANAPAVQCEVCQNQTAIVMVQEEILGRTIHFHLCAECASKISGNIKLRNGLGIVTSLVVVLKSDNPVVRASAAKYLGSLGPAAESALPVLRDQVKDQDPNVRREVAEAWRRIER